MSDGKSKIIDVGLGCLEVAHNNFVLRSSGIGSCVVITLYDPTKKIGALAHAMLPLPEQSVVQGPRYSQNEKTPNPSPYTSSLRFVEAAVDAMIKAMGRKGSLKERLEAKIIGGANMFEVFDENPNSIGLQNVEAAKKKLEKEGIEIVASDTGENCGRSVSFDLSTGLVEVKTKI